MRWKRYCNDSVDRCIRSCVRGYISYEYTRELGREGERRELEETGAGIHLVSRQFGKETEGGQGKADRGLPCKWVQDNLVPANHSYSDRTRTNSILLHILCCLHSQLHRYEWAS